MPFSLVSSSGFTFHQKNILKERITHLKKHTAHKHPIFTSIVTGFGIIFLSFSSSLTILAYNTPAIEIDNISKINFFNLCIIFTSASIMYVNYVKNVAFI